MLKNHCELELKAFLVWEEHVKMDPIEKLFNWYNIDLKSETKNDSTNKLGAEETTRIIGAAFRACQTQASPGSNTVGQFYCSQEELFKRIRRALDRASCIQDTSTTSGYNLHEKYDSLADLKSCQSHPRFRWNYGSMWRQPLNC